MSRLASGGRRGAPSRQPTPPSAPSPCSAAGRQRPALKENRPLEVTLKPQGQLIVEHTRACEVHTDKTVPVRERINRPSAIYACIHVYRYSIGLEICAARMTKIIKVWNKATKFRIECCFGYSDVGCVRILVISPAEYVYLTVSR